MNRTVRVAAVLFLAMSCNPLTCWSSALDLANPHEMEKGYSPTLETPGGGSIEVFGGGLSITVPICSFTVGPDLELGLAARYRSKDVWNVGQPWGGGRGFVPEDHSSERTNQLVLPDSQPDRGQDSELGWGWQLNLGRIGFDDPQSDAKYVFTPDGVGHKLYQLGQNEVPNWDIGDDELATHDGSRLRATWFRNSSAVPGDNDRFSNRIYKVFAPDGTIYEYGHWVGHPSCSDIDLNLTNDVRRIGWYLTSVGDRFGNRIDIEYHAGPFTSHIIKRIVDTHGRVITTTLRSGAASPILDDRIETVTFPSEDGGATVTFHHELMSTLKAPNRDPAGGPPVGADMSVALLTSIELPEGATHVFAYNDTGELNHHVIPTGAATDFVYANYSVLNSCLQSGCPISWWLLGRGVAAFTTTVDPVAPASPENTFVWVAERNQDWGATCGEQPHRVHVRDPFKMWRTYEFAPRDVVAYCDDLTTRSTSLLSKLTIWDRPFESWIDVACGSPPTGVQAHAVLEQRWARDDWDLTNGVGGTEECAGEGSERLVFTRVTFDDGSWQAVNRCGWDGLGHFEHTTLRGSTTGSSPLMAAPRFTHEIYRPIVCQWLLDLPVIRETAEGGKASVVEWAYGADGQMSDQVARVAESDFPPTGLSPGEEADYTCDNSNAPLLTLTQEFVGSDGPEYQLRAHENNDPDYVNVIGPWVTNPSHQFCNGYVGSFREQDLENLGRRLNDPGPASTCAPDARFAPPPPSLTANAGDVMTHFEYYAGSSGGAAAQDSHGHACWGQVRKSNISGGDSAATFQKLYEWSCGTAETERWAGLAWYAMDNDVQCPTGLVTTSRDPSGFATSMTHDDLGRLTTSAPNVTSPAPAGGAAQEAPTTVTYSTDLRTRTTVKRSAGAAAEDGTEFFETFDGLGRPIMMQSRRPGGVLSTRTTVYDAVDRPIRKSRWFDTTVPFDFTEGPDPDVMTYAVVVGDQQRPDPLGRLRAVTHADGTSLDVSYSGTTRTETVAGINNDPSAVAVKSLFHDMLGRLWKVEVPDDAASPAADAQYAYDMNDRMTAAQLYLPPQPPEDGQQRTWVYDGLGRLRSSTQPESGTVTGMKYDALGNPIEFTDADTRVHGASYDVAGRVTARGEIQSGALVPTDVLIYDEASSAFSAGKLTSAKVLDPATLAQLQGRYFEYDGTSGRLSEIHYQEGVQKNLVLAHWDQNDLGMTQLLRYPSGTVVEHAYEFGRLTQLGTSGDANHFVSATTYSPNGGVASRTLGNGVVEMASFDERDRLSRITAGPSAAVFDSGEYTFDGAGNLYMLGATAAHGWDRFFHDLNGRLTAASYSPMTAAYSMAYDAFGNMTSQVLGSLGDCDSWQLNEFSGRQYKMGQDNVVAGAVTNRISLLGVEPSCHPGSTVAYDNAGNILADETATYTWDIMGRMTTRTDLASSVTSAFRYDTNGWRTWATPAPGGGTEPELYYRGPAGEVLQADRDFIYADGNLVATREHLASGTNVDRWYHLDHLGSTRAVTLADGSVEGRFDYGPYGVELPRVSSGGESKRTFAGHLREGEDAVDYMMARYFSVRQARFLSTDPAPAAPDDVQGFNRYPYCGNAPLLLTDPTGCVKVDDSLKADYHLAVAYLTTVDPGRSMFAKVGTMVGDRDFSIVAGTNPNATDEVDIVSRTITWNSRVGMKILSGGRGADGGLVQSAAVGLAHEIAHFIWVDEHGRDAARTPDDIYDTLEEMHVIDDYETPLARALGEAFRLDHKGVPVPQESPTAHHDPDARKPKPGPGQ